MQLSLRKFIHQLDFIPLQSCFFEEPSLGLKQMKDGTDKLGIPLKDENHSGKVSHLFGGFLRLCFGNLPEQLSKVSVPVGSRETSPVQREQPK